MSVLAGFTKSTNTGTNSCAVAIPAPTADNPSGVGDMLTLDVGYGNGNQGAPTHNGGSSWTNNGGEYGGGGTWGANSGPRGVHGWSKVSTGTETAVTVTNTGADATGKTIRATITRWSKGPSDIGWAPMAVAFDDDSTIDTTLSIIADTDIGGLAGDMLVGVYVGAPTNNHTQGNTNVLSWPGAAGTGDLLDTGTAPGGYLVRKNSYYRTVVAPSTGRPRLDLTLHATDPVAGGASGVGMLRRLRTVATGVVNDPGSAHVALEPGFEFTNDGSRSPGANAWQWQTFDSGTWADLPGTGPVRTETAPYVVGGTTLQRRLRVSGDGGSTWSDYKTITHTVLPPTEHGYDAAGNLCAVRVLWLDATGAPTFAYVADPDEPAALIVTLDDAVAAVDPDDPNVLVIDITAAGLDVDPGDSSILIAPDA